MPRGKRTEDTTLLSMALVGYEAEKQRIEGKIREIQAQLGGHATSSPAKPTASPVAPSNGTAKKRVLSAAARKRIATAQKKRWAEHRKKEAAASKE